MAALKHVQRLFIALFIFIITTSLSAHAQELPVVNSIEIKGLKRIEETAIKSKISQVMMKSRKGWTVAVRGPKGDIHVKKEILKNIPGIFKLPVLRGAVALYQALSIGMRAIEFSARKAYEEEDKKPSNPLIMGLTIAVAIILGIAFFIVLPLYATKLLGAVLPSISKSSLLFNLD